MKAFKLLSIGVLAAVLLSACGEAAPAGSTDTASAAAEQSGSVKIDKAAFDQIKNGMSYEEVSKIIGGEGELLSESGEKGDDMHITIYMYDGKGDLGANANFTFIADKLDNKTQLGLK